MSYRYPNRPLAGSLMGCALIDYLAALVRVSTLEWDADPPSKFPIVTSPHWPSVDWKAVECIMTARMY